MIRTVPYMTRSDGVELVLTYSDAGFNIRQIETGIIYEEAVDVVPLRYTYEETDIPIEPIEDPEETEASAQEVLNILLGGESDD